MSLTIAAPCPAFEQFGEFSAVMPEAEPCFEQSHVFSSVWEIELTTVAELGLVLAPNVSAHIKADLVLEVNEGYGVQSAVAMHNTRDPARAVLVGDLVLNDRVVGYTRILRIARWTWSVAPRRTKATLAPRSTLVPLGITMMGPPKAGRVRVLEIQMATAFAEWNRAHPQLALQPGDELLSVEDLTTGTKTLGGTDLAMFTTALKKAVCPKLLVLRVPQSFR